MILTIIVFALILSLLVFVHELGHFLVAKKVGVKVEEFGFGLPPRIWGIQKGETIYSINWLPIGGFVKLAGEDMDELESGKSGWSYSEKTVKTNLDSIDTKRFFWARSKKERSAILLAGVTMNFVLAIAIISFIFTQGVFVPTDRIHVEKTIANGPASAAGLESGDIILSFGGKLIKTTEDLIKTTQKYAGEPVLMVIERKGVQYNFTITPRKDPPKEEGPMGVVISNLEEKKYKIYEAPFFGTLEALKISALMIGSLGGMLWRFVTFQKVALEVAGPIGIAQATGQAIKLGFIGVLELTGLLSLNLAIINILPIPALDGGRLLFVILEKFLGRRVKPAAERVMHQIGMVFLLGLFVLVTIHDILRLIHS